MTNDKHYGNRAYNHTIYTGDFGELTHMDGTIVFFPFQVVTGLKDIEEMIGAIHALADELACWHCVYQEIEKARLATAPDPNPAEECYRHENDQLAHG